MGRPVAQAVDEIASSKLAHEPFFLSTTDLRRKKPLGEEDIKLTVDLLERIKPHQIYAAGDLSGAAVLAAIVILCRELLVSGLREYLAELRVPLPVSRLAKWSGGEKLTVCVALYCTLAALRAALRERSSVRSDLRGDPGKSPTGGKRGAEPIAAAVATPANAYGAQRIVTLDAFRRAGFDVIAMLNEPSAAGFEYTHRHGDTVTSRGQSVVVSDLGGGTFDASLLETRDGLLRVVGHDGDNFLGGRDFDWALVDWILAEIARTQGVTVSRSDPTQAAAIRKLKLAVNSKARIVGMPLIALPSDSVSASKAGPRSTRATGIENALATSRASSSSCGWL